MEAADVFRQQGLVSVMPRQPHQLQQPQYLYPRRQPPHIPQYPFLPYPPQIPIPGHPQPSQQHVQRREDVSDKDAAASDKHILTACCRCRRKKMGCDPGLPKCTRCARAGATCEYYDATKGKVIPRKYVVTLQEKARQLKAELAQYVKDDAEYPKTNEEMVSPGGFVSLKTDETPRYLGPSSGIAMTRLVIEAATRYTQSKKISELFPEARAKRMERMDRMHSVVGFRQSFSNSLRKKSYPMTSEHPAEGLPTRAIGDKLAEVYCQRAQVFTPTLHEKVLLQDVDAVFNGDTDPYRNFVVRMVMAISLQKLDTQYAGLADGYYLAAMQYFEDVVRPKDLKTLQCLVLIGQYSLLTSTRTPVYFVIGFATRICQQLGLGEEKTLCAGYDVNPLTLDMRRRLAWIIATNEFGLAQSMGRPNGFAKTNDFMNVGYFSTVDDENITSDGIKPGEPCGKKLVSVHFCKMRLLQAEIRRVLYERSLPEKPRDENHPWFAQMEDKIKGWLDSSPPKPGWCKPWFTGRYHTIVITLYRPSPQVPEPTPRAALKCYDSAAYIITLSSQQVIKGAIDVTWVFLLTLYMALNTILWTVSYPEVRAAHGKDIVEEMIHVALDIVEQCSERWPGAGLTPQLYGAFWKACMQGYESKGAKLSSSSHLNTPQFSAEASSTSPSGPDVSGPLTGSAGPSFGPQQQQHHRHHHHHQEHQQPAPNFSPPQFGHVFGATAEDMKVEVNFEQNLAPTFRSNSIFASPNSDSRGRKFSYFPPDATEPPGRRGSYFLPEWNQQQQFTQIPMPNQSDEATPSATTTPYNHVSSPAFQPPFSGHTSPPVPSVASSLPSPSDSLTAPYGNLSPTPTMTARGTASPAPTLSHNNSPAPSLSAQNSPMVLPTFKQEPPDLQPPRQRMVPQNVASDWFSPPPPMISPYAVYSVMGGAGLLDAYSPELKSQGLANMLGGQDVGMTGMQYSFPVPERHGSLSQQQQMELMDVLETDGLGEIDAFLQAPVGLGLSGRGMDGIRWGG